MQHQDDGTRRVNYFHPIVNERKLNYGTFRDNLHFFLFNLINYSNERIKNNKFFKEVVFVRLLRKVCRMKEREKK